MKGRVTYATSEDAWTESRSKASPQDLKRHSSSGLPKRPSIGKDFDEREVLFDKADVEENVSGMIGELVIDNWTYDTLIYDYKKRMREIYSISRPIKYKIAEKKRHLSKIEKLKEMGINLITDISE